MSNASPTSSENSADPDARSGGSSPGRVLLAPVRFVSFWAAVAIPALYLPLLASGLSGNQTAVFLGLLAANVVALVAGHGYGR